jgi:trans-aconitate methyltransferase
MTAREALELLEGAVPREAGTWADLGAGDGTFTRALVERLEPEARIVAVDRDAKAIGSIRRWAAKHAPNVTCVVADMARPFEWPELDGRPLAGLLLANSLHFVAEGGAALARLAARLGPRGRVVVIEYDQHTASRWVPYPIPVERLPELVQAAGLTTPAVVARRASAFGGEMYVAVAERAAASADPPAH